MSGILLNGMAAHVRCQYALMAMSACFEGIAGAVSCVPVAWVLHLQVEGSNITNCSSGEAGGVMAFYSDVSGNGTVQASSLSRSDRVVHMASGIASGQI